MSNFKQLPNIAISLQNFLLLKTISVRVPWCIPINTLGMIALPQLAKLPIPVIAYIMSPPNIKLSDKNIK
jgi:hypothetical protein